MSGISWSQRVGEAMAALTSGAHDLTAISGKPARAARRVICLTEVTFTTFADASGTNCAPSTALPAGTVIDSDVSAIEFASGECWIFW
jgi:hypothetical protein